MLSVFQITNRIDTYMAADENVYLKIFIRSENSSSVSSVADYKLGERYFLNLKWLKLLSNCLIWEYIHIYVSISER